MRRLGVLENPSRLVAYQRIDIRFCELLDLPLAVKDVVLVTAVAPARGHAIPDSQQVLIVTRLQKDTTGWQR